MPKSLTGVQILAAEDYKWKVETVVSIVFILNLRLFNLQKTRQTSNSTDSTHFCFLLDWLARWNAYQLRTQEEKRYNLRLCAMGIMLQTPRTLTKKTLGDRAFLAAAPKLWNGLPSQIQNEPNFNRFKGLLKTHLFRLAFYQDYFLYHVCIIFLQIHCFLEYFQLFWITY